MKTIDPFGETEIPISLIEGLENEEISQDEFKVFLAISMMPLTSKGLFKYFKKLGFSRKRVKNAIQGLESKGFIHEKETTA